jgi:hypothetical protein
LVKVLSLIRDLLANVNWLQLWHKKESL